MSSYFVPPELVHSVERDLPIELCTAGTGSRSGFEELMRTRTSARFFEDAPLDISLLEAMLIQPLLQFETEITGIRFVLAIRDRPDSGTVFGASAAGPNINPIRPSRWSDLYLQEEYSSAPAVAVAIVNIDCGWRDYEKRVIRSTSALAQVWAGARLGAPALEGSIFAGVLAGWLRSAGVMRGNETSGVALALGVPARPRRNGVGAPQLGRQLNGADE